MRKSAKNYTIAEGLLTEHMKRKTKTEDKRRLFAKELYRKKVKTLANPQVATDTYEHLLQHENELKEYRRRTANSQCTKDVTQESRHEKALKALQAYKKRKTEAKLKELKKLSPEEIKELAARYGMSTNVFCARYGIPNPCKQDASYKNMITKYKGAKLCNTKVS